MFPIPFAWMAGDYQIPDIAQAEITENCLTDNEENENYEDFVLNNIEETNNSIETPEETPVVEETMPFILDMDFCTDVDDACALRMAANLHKQGAIDLKAVTLSTNGENNVNLTAVDGMLAYSGLNTPIGIASVYEPDISPYWNIMSEYSDGFDSYDAVKLWRKTIVENDHVTIVTTGYLTNFCEFCKSGPDEYSDKTGLELLEKADVYIVGGGVPEGKDNNFFFSENARESAKWISQNVTHPLIFVTNNIGGEFSCGGELQKTYHDDLLSKALFSFGTDCGRYAWDEAGVYAAVKKEDFSFIKTDIIFDEDGKNTFIDSENGKYLRIEKIKPNDYYKEEIENLLFP